MRNIVYSSSCLCRCVWRYFIRTGRCMCLFLNGMITATRSLAVQLVGNPADNPAEIQVGDQWPSSTSGWSDSASVRFMVCVVLIYCGPPGSSSPSVNTRLYQMRTIELIMTISDHHHHIGQPPQNSDLINRQIIWIISSKTHYLGPS